MSEAKSDLALSTDLRRWLFDTLGDRGPFELLKLSGGSSNETLLLRSPRGDRIVRRPPAASIGPDAHDLKREWQLLVAFQDAAVPTPRPLGFCDDPDIAPGPFIIMEALNGVAIFDRLPDGYAPGPATVSAIGAAAINALAAVHQVDWRALGLTGFGRPEGFLDRQVPRWRRQFEHHQVRELDVFSRVAAWLEANQPGTFEAGVMHGDFHLDNCLLRPRAPISVAGIIDWEMATIGDPLLDLGLFLALWGSERPSDLAMPRVQGVSRIAGAMTRADLASRYAELTGRTLEHLDYYLTLALWKLAAIVEGAYANFVRGKIATPYARELERDVPRLLAEAAAFAGVEPG